MRIGACADRTLPPTVVVELARSLEAAGADRLWVIEDCFYTAGVSLAAASLAVTERLGVGLGILPAVARNPAVTAMEIATLCGLGPDRVVAGIGHGVQEWMGQMGARPSSPVTTLGEVIEAVRRLLTGERVSMDGKVVTLDAVQLDQPPEPVPPVLAGVRGPRSLELAGRVADGVLLAEPASPTYVRWAVEQAGSPDGFTVAVFSALCVMDDGADARRAMAPWLAGIVESTMESPSVGIRVLPFGDELVARYERDGVDGLATMPAEWWTEIGPIGTYDDAHAHLDALAAAGVAHAGLFLAPDPEIALADVSVVGRIISDRARSPS